MNVQEIEDLLDNDRFFSLSSNLYYIQYINAQSSSHHFCLLFSNNMLYSFNLGTFDIYSMFLLEKGMFWIRLGTRR